MHMYIHVHMYAYLPLSCDNHVDDPLRQMMIMNQMMATARRKLYQNFC